MFLRIRNFSLLFPLLLTLLPGGLCCPGAAFAQEAHTYAAQLDQAVTVMEQGKHPQALVPLRNAFITDRNEAYGRLVLATLYLHCGSPGLASKEFAVARLAAPDEPIAAWGSALCQLAQGQLDPTLFTPFERPDDTMAARIPADTVAVAPLLAQYTRLLADEASGVRHETETVTEGETDSLKLEIAAFAAMRGGDVPHGESLMHSLLARPAMRTLSEDPALDLTFDPLHPLTGEAPGLPSTLLLPEAPHTSTPLTGRVTLRLLPPDMANDAAYVTYSLDGGAFSATTNNSPFELDWNTARMPNGIYTLRTTVFDSNRRILRESTRVVTLSNASAPHPTRLSDDQIARLRARLWALLLPHPCRKAAHFALAEQAVAQREIPVALSELETVCAIDPTFHDAYGSLRQYYQETLGPREGIWQARTPDKIVALTFDDGPNPLPSRTPALLDALKVAKAPATFFVVGWRAEQSPDLLRRMKAEGHEIANHTYSHLNLTFLTPQEVQRELCRTTVIVRDATGNKPHFYRPPGGNNNTTAVEAAAALGMSGAYWTIDGVNIEEDPNATPDVLTRFVMSHMRPGAIVLLHNAPYVTTAAIPKLVNALRAKGYTLVTMTELVQRARRDPLRPTPSPTPAVTAARPSAKPH